MILKIIGDWGLGIGYWGLGLPEGYPQDTAEWQKGSMDDA